MEGLFLLAQRLFVYPFSAMSPEVEFLLDILLVSLPYFIVLIFVPITIIVVRFIFKGACRNGPLQRYPSAYDDEFWAEFDKIEMGEQENSNINLMDWFSPTISIHKSVNIEDDHCAFCNIKFEPISPIIISPNENSPATSPRSLLPPPSPTKTLPCKHIFHEECAERWTTQNGVCPLCIRPTCRKEFSF